MRLEGLQRERHRIRRMTTRQMMTIAPHHSHETGTVEAKALAFLGLVHLVRIHPLDPEEVVEVGALFAVSILERPVRSVAGNLKASFEDRRFSREVLHGNC